MTTPPPTASEIDAIIEAGVQLREKGRDEDALREFTRAFEASKSPRAQAQMALAHQALGRWIAADREMRAALATTGDSWIELHRSALVGALAAVGKHLGYLDVVGGLEGAEIFVDGVKMGVLPLRKPLRAIVGNLVLEVRAAGYYTVSRGTVINPEATTRESIELFARPKLVETPSEPRSPALEVAVPTRGASQRLVGWSVFGAGGVLAATGLVALGVRQSIVSSYNSNHTCPGDSVAADQQSGTCADKLQAGSTWNTVQLIGLIGGGALAATGLAIVMTAPRAKPRTEGLGFSFDFDRQTAGVRCNGVF